MCLVATEDALSEAVALRLLEERMVDSQYITCLGREGLGYLKRSLPKFSSAARNGRGVFMLTDLDQGPCAPGLHADWFAGAAIHPRFLFRVVVREIETWLMADHSAFAAFLGISPARIERNIEDIPLPKEYLLQLAARARRDVRSDLLPCKGATASKGFGYNQRLIAFVRRDWCARRASETAPSLLRARLRLEAWVPHLHTLSKVQ